MSSIRPTSPFRHPHLVRTEASRAPRSTFETRAPEPRRPDVQPRSWRDGFEDLSQYKPRGLGSLDGASKPSAPSYGSTLSTQQFGGDTKSREGRLEMTDKGPKVSFQEKAGERTLGVSLGPDGKPEVTFSAPVGSGEAHATFGGSDGWKVGGKIPVAVVGGVPVSVETEATPDSFALRTVAGVESELATAEAGLGGVYKLGDGLDLNADATLGVKPSEDFNGKLKLTGNLDPDEGLLTFEAGFEGRAGPLKVSPKGEWQLRLWGEPPPVVGGAIPPGYVPEEPAPTGLPTTVGGLTVGGAPLEVPEDYGTGPTGLVPGGAMNHLYVDMGAGPRPELVPPPTVGGMVMGGVLGPRPFSGNPLAGLEETSPLPSAAELGLPSDSELRMGGAMLSGTELALGFDDGSVDPFAFEDTGLRTGGAWDSLIESPPVSPEPVSPPEENSSFFGGLFGLGGGGATGSW